MTEFNIDNELLLSLADIIKSVIPLFAAIIASYLTYRFSKKDKIRDHLFTYKVKAYSSMAQGILVIQKDIISLLNDVKFKQNRQDYLKSPTQILTEFNQISNENLLFISKNIKGDLAKIEIAIMDAFGGSLQGLTGLEDDNLEERYQRVFNECNDFIKSLQNDLEIYRLNKNSKF